MKKHISISIYLVLLTLFHYQLYANNPEKDSTLLQLSVKNIKHDQGKILIAIFNTEETFMQDRYLEEAVNVTSFGDLEVKLELPYGEYAFSIFHDENDDEKLNTNLIGIPKEPYWFSNNPKITFGPPNFKETSFILGKDKYEIEIILK